MALLNSHPLSLALLLLTEGHLVASLNSLVAPFVLCFLKPYQLFYSVGDCSLLTMAHTALSCGSQMAFPKDSALSIT